MTDSESVVRRREVPEANCDLAGPQLQLEELYEIRLAQLHADGLPLNRNLDALALCCPAYLNALTELARRATTDPLTGLLNHGLFRSQLIKSSPDRTAVIVIDVDDFKQVNDNHGHQEGDRTLVSLADGLRKVLRNADDLYRIGGDEFAVILNVNCPSEVIATAERLLNSARCVGPTVSIGAALCLKGETGEETWERADGALYLAKGAGRDTVRLSPGRDTVHLSHKRPRST